MLPDLSPAHILIVIIVALVVVGPKDLPMLLRKIGQFMGKMRGMANEFRASFDEMARQSELDELRKEVEAMRKASQAALPQDLGVEAALNSDAESAYMANWAASHGQPTDATFDALEQNSILPPSPAAEAPAPQASPEPARAAKPKAAQTPKAQRPKAQGPKAQSARAEGVKAAQAAKAPRTQAAASAKAVDAPRPRAKKAKPAAGGDA